MSQTLPRLAIAAFATALAAGVAFLVWRANRGPRSTVVVTVTPGTAPEPSWDGQPTLVIDPIAGFRPRRSSTWRHPMTAIGGAAADAIVKHRCAHGFLRANELPEALDRPCVVVVGDSHVDGVVSTADNFTSRLEEQATTAGSPCYFLNAGCGFYSLWQSVLRAGDLLRYRPAVLVIVVFLGNDFLELEKTTVPHLDDELHELPGGEARGPETTSQRQTDLALPPQHQLLFWQGLDQALYVHRNPARFDAIVRKSAHAVEVMERTAAANGARVVWALLPSFDLVFPDVAAGLGPLAKEVVQGGAQRRLRDAFAATLTQRAATVVDLEPAFRADAGQSLYAIDFHVYRRGHERIAEALQGPIQALLHH